MKPGPTSQERQGLRYIVLQQPTNFVWCRTWQKSFAILAASLPFECPRPVRALEPTKYGHSGENSLRTSKIDDPTSLPAQLLSCDICLLGYFPFH